MAGGRVLEFKDYIGGADNVIVEEMFKGTKKTFTYDFDTSLTSYSFSADFESLLLDEVTYDRSTGKPNFTSTKVKGYFDNYAAVPSGNIVKGATTVAFTIPDDRYTGWQYPNAREDVVMTIVSFQWVLPNGDQDLHRWAIIERWEPGITIGDPESINNTVTFTALT